MVKYMLKNVHFAIVKIGEIMEAKYQQSVSCHCSKFSIDVKCYGSFEYSEGVCSNCGAIHIGRQIKTQSGHRYETEIKHSPRSKFLYFKTATEDLLRAI